MDHSVLKKMSEESQDVQLSDEHAQAVPPRMVK